MKTSHECSLLLRWLGRAPAVLFLLASAVDLTAADQSPPAASVEIGSRLELFVDDYLIDRMAGVQLKLHEPRPAGTTFVFDQPWEGVTSGITSANGRTRDRARTVRTR